MNKPRWVIAGDYACLETDRCKFYYGYEETMSGEWCFTAEIPGADKIVVPYSKLGLKDANFECDECLMMGIGWVLTKYPLQVPAIVATDDIKGTK